MGFLQWLTWVFVHSSESQRLIFCVAIWAIWGDRNNRLHNKGSKSGKEIARFVNSYISELDAVGKNYRETPITVKKWEKLVDRVVKINFDAAYEIGQKKSGYRSCG
ncbi:hypothetical protein Goshw_007925 [Gossypium schwendimanii]|uniref:Myb/SANT-like domain-containing protein n=1 Tax=Gossypium schwendimanii TaxID=34291 RepID=A0A7J9MRR0_GOSSC|nr:hypothetical protein [Gossypium schwendimanii]